MGILESYPYAYPLFAVEVCEMKTNPAFGLGDVDDVFAGAA